MQTLTYGLKLPETGDQGISLFEALEDNITQLDGHTHDGVDSPNLSPQAMPGVTQTISSASWVASGAAGHYRQQVTVPAGFDFDTVTIGFRTTAGAIIYPTVEKVSDTQYYVYTSDNTINFLAVYGG
jgi:hypothetical protein